MEELEHNQTDQHALNTTTNILSNFVGAIVGAKLGGPQGAVLGGLTGPIIAESITYIVQEFNNRVLSPREKRRVSATINFAAAQIKRNLESGKIPRQDEFFQEKPEDRAVAEEIAEGVLLAAQRAYEEKKLPYYGTLLSSIFFRSDIDRTLANALITQADHLTYYQYGILSIALRPETILWPATNDMFQPTTDMQGVRAEILRREMDDLAQRALLEVLRSGDGVAVFNLMQAGRFLAELMELQTMDIEELRALGLIAARSND